MSDLEVVPIPNGQFVENCYLLGDPEAGEAVVVDPGEETDRVLAELARRRWRATGLWVTHAHLDHILGVGPVKVATGAPIFLHPADRGLYDQLPSQAEWLGLRVPPAPPPDAGFTVGGEVAVGRHRFTVRHTPGHSPGSVSLVGPGLVLTGDALFAGSVGRTDLPGGDFETLIQSIRRELLTLDDGTRVLAGHGPETTIGRERRTNPFLLAEG